MYLRISDKNRKEARQQIVDINVALSEEMEINMTVFELYVSTSRPGKKNIFPVYSGSDTNYEDIVHCVSKSIPVFYL